MRNDIDYDEEHYCPLCKQVLQPMVCYEIVMCFFGGLTLTSVPEVYIEKNDMNKNICGKCPYSDIE